MPERAKCLARLTSTSRSLRVPFGLREGRLYEPLQVVSGLQCGCTCPGCGVPLVARHYSSGRVVSHFAHDAGADCATGFETAIHRAAKQLIADRMELFLPVVVARAPGIGVSGRDFSRGRVLRPAGVSSLNAVRVEEKLGAIKPDLIVTLGRQEVLVEIAVTSFVKNVKLTRIQALEMPAVEIDLSKERRMTFEALESALFTNAQQAEWVWHPERESEKSRLQAFVDADLAKDYAVWAEAERVRLHQEAEAHVAQLQEVKQARLLAQKSREAAWKKAAAARQRVTAFRDAPETEKLRRLLEHLGAVEAQLHEFLPVHMTARRAIAAPPLLWQAAVFSGLIHPALRKGSPELTAEAVRAWIEERFEVLGDEKAFGVAVWQYLEGLQKLGLVHHEERQRFLVAISGWSGALAVVADAKQGCVVPLVWVREWPEGNVVARLAAVFGKIHGATEKWRRLGGLCPEVRGLERVEDTVLHYAENGLEALRVRQFFLAAGFARLAGKCPSAKVLDVQTHV